MKKVLLSLAAVSAIAVAAPAAAQSYRQADARVDAQAINRQQADLAQRINRSFQRGQISRAEANRLVAELRKIEALEHRYRAGGLNRWERDQLNARLNRVQALLRVERRDDDNRRYGAGYGRR